MYNKVWEVFVNFFCEKKHAIGCTYIVTVEKQQERTQLSVHDLCTNGLGVQLQVSNLSLFKLDTDVIAHWLRDK